MKPITVIVLAACAVGAGCATYTERVVEKPVAANRVATTERTYYTDAYGQPAATTTVYTTR